MRVSVRQQRRRKLARRIEKPEDFQVVKAKRFHGTMNFASGVNARFCVKRCSL